MRIMGKKSISSAHIGWSLEFVTSLWNIELVSDLKYSRELWHRDEEAQNGGPL